MCLRQFAQLLGREFRSHITLRGCQQFEAHHELLDGGGAQQGREEVRVEVPLRMFAAIGRSLMKSHRVWEGSLKQIVVAGGEAFQDVRQTRALCRVQGIDIGSVTLAQE